MYIVNFAAKVSIFAQQKNYLNDNFVFCFSKSINGYIIAVF